MVMVKTFWPHDHDTCRNVKWSKKCVQLTPPKLLVFLRFVSMYVEFFCHFSSIHQGYQLSVQVSLKSGKQKIWFLHHWYYRSRIQNHAFQKNIYWFTYHLNFRLTNLFTMFLSLSVKPSISQHIRFNLEPAAVIKLSFFIVLRKWQLNFYSTETSALVAQSCRSNKFLFGSLYWWK